MLAEGSVEERMRRPGIRLEVVLDLRGRQCGVEGGDVRRRDARVVATKETEDGRAHARRLFSRDRPDFVLALAEPAIETDDAREPDCSAEARNAMRPPKQKPRTKTRRALVSVSSFERLAAMSAKTLFGVVCRTCGMYSKSSARRSIPAVRPK